MDPTVQYQKPWLSIDDQVALLDAREMDVEPRDETAAWLQRVGYYRLSGYWYPLRDSRQPEGGGRPVVLDTFRAGARFSDVVAAYEFDRQLRLHVLGGVERIEVSIRFLVGHELGRRGAFAHTTPGSLDSEFAPRLEGPNGTVDWMSSDHASWLQRRAQEEKRSKTDFVKHFKAKYGVPLPVWVVTEILDFGGLSYLYGGLQQQDRDVIASKLGLLDQSGVGHSGALKDWLKNLSYVRNTCAHHGRFWNMNVVERLSTRLVSSIPELAHISVSGPRATSRPYASLAVIAMLSRRIGPDSSWVSELVELIDRLPARQSETEMGFPDGWRDFLVWEITPAPS